MSKYLIEVEIPKTGIFDQGRLGSDMEVEIARVKILTEELIKWLSEADIYTDMSKSTGEERQSVKERFIGTIYAKFK